MPPKFTFAGAKSASSWTLDAVPALRPRATFCVAQNDREFCESILGCGGYRKQRLVTRVSLWSGIPFDRAPKSSSQKQPPAKTRRNSLISSLIRSSDPPICFSGDDQCTLVGVEWNRTSVFFAGFGRATHSTPATVHWHIPDNVAGCGQTF